MSQSQSTDRVEELGSIFVAVTGDDTVTEPQDDEPKDRELRPDDELDDEAVADGLGDAVAGADTAETTDPAG